jgi:HAD superfamily hydrolase (TIGR01459 family)
MTRVIHHLSEISPSYDALFCDVWGVVHNGIAPFDAATDALRAYREAGGAVVLVTNAPRQRAVVERQLDKIGVPRDSWDVVATSGDAARVAMFTGAIGRKVWFMGEEKDHVFFEPMKLIDNPVEIEVVELDEAEGIVCCGPFDPHADPATLRPELLLAKQKRLPLLCANPDIHVDVGETRIWCAGAIAQLYTEMGGDSLYFGKPHPPIYDLARRRLAEIGRDVPDGRILCVGDGIGTDIRGATGEDLDSLLITGGLAAAETMTKTDHPDPEALEAWLDAQEHVPSYAMGFLR